MAWYGIALSLVVSCCWLGTAQRDTAYSADFEGNTGDPRFRAFIHTCRSPKPCNQPTPTASANSSSSVAARSGSRGVLIIVKQPSMQGWHVSFKSPSTLLTPSRLYTYCLWARLGPATPAATASVSTNINLIAADTGQWITGTPAATGPNPTPNSVTITRVWQRFCLREVQVPAATSAYFALALGGAAAEYHLDDASLEWQALDPGWADPARVAARIEAQRKGDFTIRVALGGPGGSGAPLSALRASLTRHDFLFGTAYEPEPVPSDDLPWYRSTAASLFNTLVPEWSFKWPSYEPTRGSVQARHDYMEKHFLAFPEAPAPPHVRGHTLEWYTEGYPEFVNHFSRQANCSEYRVLLKERIQRDVGAFAGRIHSYDVFNEVTHWRARMDECGLWDSAFVDAWGWAHAADPAARLCLNDFGLIDGGSDNRWPQLHGIVSGLLAKKAPIHCIGIQAYLQPGQTSLELMSHRLDRLATLGLPLIISEFLFPTGQSGGKYVNSQDDAALADTYERYMSLWFSHPAVQGMVLWGFWDGLLWVANSGLFRADKTPKPAAERVRALLQQAWNTTASATAAELASRSLAFRGFYGRYRVTATRADGKAYACSVEVPASAGANQTLECLLAPARPMWAEQAVGLPASARHPPPLTALPRADAVSGPALGSAQAQAGVLLDRRSGSGNRLAAVAAHAGRAHLHPHLSQELAAGTMQAWLLLATAACAAAAAAGCVIVVVVAAVAGGGCWLAAGRLRGGAGHWTAFGLCTDHASLVRKEGPLLGYHFVSQLAPPSPPQQQQPSLGHDVGLEVLCVPKWHMGFGLGRSAKSKCYSL